MPSRTPTRLLTLALAACASSLLPAGAARAATVRYDVVVKTDVDLKLHRAWGNAKNGGDRHFQFHSELYSELRGVEFVDGRITPYLGGGQVDEANSGFYAAEDRSESSGTKHLHCEAELERFSPWGRASLDATGLDRRTIALRVTDELEYLTNCDDGRSPGYRALAIDGSADDYDGPFDGVFELPAEAIGQGKIIQLVESPPVTRETCPGRDESTTACEFAWQAEVTFTRSDFVEPPAPPAVPGPPSGGGQAGPAGPGAGSGSGAPPAGSDPLVRNVTDAIEDYLDERRIADSIAKAFRDHGRSARVQLDCPGPCSGTVSAYAVASAKAAASGKPIATGTFGPLGGGKRLATGATEAEEAVTTPMLATLRFGAAGRRAIAKRRYVALRFAMRTGADPAVRRATVVVKVRRR